MNRHRSIAGAPTSSVAGWRTVARLAISPFSLAQAARKTSAAQATVAMIVMFTLGVWLPLASIGAARNEPFRDLTRYAGEIVSCMPRIILWTSPLLAPLFLVLAAPARLAEANGCIRLAAELRAIMFAPFALVIPMAVWCVMFAGGLTTNPGFNLLWYEQNGIPSPSRHVVVVLLGDGRWWPTGAIAAALLAFRAIRSFNGMPRLDGLPYCRECFYNLVGNKSGICPECGLAIDTAVVAGASINQGAASAATTNSAVADTGCE